MILAWSLIVLVEESPVSLVLVSRYTSTVELQVVVGSRSFHMVGLGGQALLVLEGREEKR